MKNSFQDIQSEIGSALRMLSDNLSYIDDYSLSVSSHPVSSWDILYGNESREAVKKLKEASMWLEAAELSVG